MKNHFKSIKNEQSDKTLEQISKVLLKLQDVDNSKADSIRLLKLFLEKENKSVTLKRLVEFVKF